MHDLKAIREDGAGFDAALKRRKLEPQSTTILALDVERRAVQTQAQELQAQRNALATKIGAVKKAGGNADALMAQVAVLKDQSADLELQEKALGEHLTGMLEIIPNLPAGDVPDGEDENDNIEIRRWGDIPNIPDAKDHVTLAENLGLIDFERAAKLSGSRFAVMKGKLAQLERALGQFMIDLHTREHGYTEYSVPLLVNSSAMYGTGNLPKFGDGAFQANSGQWLIPTSEVSLTNLVADEILNANDLPLRMTALTPCFRDEAGSAGRDTRGILRLHQFYKVEMISITRPEDSVAEHERMLACAQKVLELLKLPYRTVVLCTGDMGFASQKTYDIEVWLPGQNKYREISSCSNCGPFQARRMNARLKRKDSKQTEFVHTLNGSGIAVGRALIAVLENYQQPDGSITIPEVLQPYMGGLTAITA